MSLRPQMHAKVRAYERNGSDVPLGEEQFIQLESHWNEDNKVTLQVGDQIAVVVADDLLEAVKRCSR